MSAIYPLKKPANNVLRPLKARDELLEIVSHEMKNPLAALSLQTKVFQDFLNQKVTEQNLEYMTQLAQNSENHIRRMEKLLDRMIWLLDNN
ncbi:MAG: hypothetical protein H0V66_09455 [Bdellovibrionales bacterium]|nr:hypothetical protein [Bdellovibrionales bacterium]